MTRGGAGLPREVSGEGARRDVWWELLRSTGGGGGHDVSRSVLSAVGKMPSVREFCLSGKNKCGSGRLLLCGVLAYWLSLRDVMMFVWVPGRKWRLQQLRSYPWPLVTVNAGRPWQLLRCRLRCRTSCDCSPQQGASLASSMGNVFIFLGLVCTYLDLWRRILKRRETSVWGLHGCFWSGWDMVHWYRMHTKIRGTHDSLLYKCLCFLPKQREHGLQARICSDR